MKIVNQGYKILTELNEVEILKKLEAAGRVCYKSEDLTTEDSCYKFINIIKTKSHFSVIEHFSITVQFSTDRGISHEIVRHRLASFSQSSTRYCNYSKDKFGNEITVIKPSSISKGTIAYEIWERACLQSEVNYMALLDSKCSPQQARAVLPNSLQTDIVVTANLREWLHILDLRTSKAAHPDMRDLMLPLQSELIEKLPSIFSVE